MTGHNGVIDLATGDLIRAGFCEWTCDEAVETVVADVPHPPLVRWATGEAQMHRWTGTEWALVDQPEQVESPWGSVLS